MSNDNAQTTADRKPAVGAPVERGVRPHAEMLARRLQAAAYNHGYEDAHPANATTRQDKTDAVSRQTLADLLIAIAALGNEAERLSGALKKANDQTEHFEREWYLRGHALEDVAMMLKRCAWALRRGTAPELGERALELLKRHDLLDTPLRTDVRSGFDTLPDDYEAPHGA